MKTMKKLQVAVAAGALCAAAGSSMAANISQSGLTVAREAISANVAITQTLRAPTVSYSFDNGPTANAGSTQDFNVTLVLGGDGAAEWDAQVATYKTVAAYRRNNGNAIVPVLPAAEVANVGAGNAALVLLSVDVWPALDPAADAASATVKQKYRYKFRLVNNSAAPVAIGDLQLVFNGQNPGDGAAAPWITANATLGAAARAAGAGDYAQVTKLATAVNAVPVLTGTDAGNTGNVEDGCGEGIRKITVLGRNYIGAGDGVQGESQGTAVQSLLNGGYIQFQTALGVHMEKGVAVDRNTDPLTSNNALTLPGGWAAGMTTTTMALGTVKFTNRALDAFDTNLLVPYYKFGPNDLNGVPNEINGSVDVGSLQIKIDGTNGFSTGAAIGLSTSPVCDPAATTVWGLTTQAGNTATASFTLAQLGTIFTSAAPDNGLLDTSAASGAVLTPFNIAAPGTSDRAYVCMQVTGAALIPQSRFQNAVATVYKNHSIGAIGAEQSNSSCPATLAGLGGGIKIDVRNYSEFPADSPWRTYVRVINNSETQTADVWAQYIRADGNYGRYVKLFDLPPRAARFLSDTEIAALMATQGQVSASRGVAGKDGYASDGVYANGNARLRISSDAASTLRVQNYLVNASKGLLSEISGAQGADFMNLESSATESTDHQDAQTGIKK